MPRKDKARRLRRYTIEEDHRLAHRQVFNFGQERTPRGWRRRHAFLLLVKTTRPKERWKDFVDFFNRIDEVLYAEYKKTRCEMGIHERVTYDLEGDYQLAVLWDAPDKETADKFLKVWLKEKGVMSISPESGLKGSNNMVTGQSRYR